MCRRVRWWVAAMFVGTLVISLLGPVQLAAQESTGEPVAAGQPATVMIDTPLYAEPTPESTQTEWLTAGSPITLLDMPLPSMFDGQLWIRIATPQSSGYLPMTVISTEPADPVVAPEPVIVDWQLIQSTTDVPCLAEPRTDAAVLALLLPGQEVGFLAAAADGWQQVRCADQNGFVPAAVFEVPIPAQTPETVETPVPETSETPAPDPSSSAVPVTSSPEDATAASPETASATPEPPSPTTTSTPNETPADTATPLASPDTADAPQIDQVTSAAAEITVLSPDPVATEVAPEVSAIIGGGTGYVRGTEGAGLRCRAGANLSAATIAVLPEGAAITSRGSVSGDWQPVYCSGQSGFVWAEFVGNTPGASTSGSVGTVQGTEGAWLRCRSTGSYAAAVITTLAPGTSATIRGSAQGGWIPVICGGQNGWVHGDYFGAGGSSGTSSGGFAIGQTVHVAGTDGAGVRFRSSASYDGAVISALPEGSGLTVRSGSSGEWVAVTRNGTNGFVHRDFLAAGAGSTSSGSVGTSDLTGGSHARVTEPLRLRSGASLSASTLAVATAGIVVKITGGKSNGYYPVSWGAMNGYMSGDYLEWTNASLSSGPSTAPGTTTPVGNAGSGVSTSTGLAIVDYALRYVGYPYVWGGRGPDEFDCAGFVYWVNFKTTGIDLVGGVINQYTYGRPVPWGQLQPGDIVNFANTYMPGLSHNGIYIGNNQFVHASNPTDGVIVSNLTNNYYLTRWYGARRII